MVIMVPSVEGVHPIELPAVWMLDEKPSQHLQRPRGECRVSGTNDMLEVLKDMSLGSTERSMQLVVDNLNAIPANLRIEVGMLQEHKRL